MHQTDQHSHGNTMIWKQATKFDIGSIARFRGSNWAEGHYIYGMLIGVKSEKDTVIYVCEDPMREQYFSECEVQDHITLNKIERLTKIGYKLSVCGEQYILENNNHQIRSTCWDLLCQQIDDIDIEKYEQQYKSDCEWYAANRDKLIRAQDITQVPVIEHEPCQCPVCMMLSRKE